MPLQYADKALRVTCSTLIEPNTFLDDQVGFDASESTSIDDFIAQLEAEGLKGMDKARQWVGETYYAPKQGEPATLAALRLRAGLSQAALARAIGVHQSDIARMESGRHRPRIDKAGKIATVLGVSIEDLNAALELAQNGRKHG